MEFVSVPQEHLNNINNLFGDRNAVRNYLMGHGIGTEGYPTSSGTLNSSLASVAKMFRIDEDEDNPTYYSHGLPDTSRPMGEALTPRTFDVVRALVHGTDKQVGASLNIADDRVSNLLREASYQTGLNSRELLIKRYTQEWKDGLYPEYPAPVEVHEAAITDDEVDVLALIVERYSYIAEQLGIVVRTVKARVERLRNKLGLDNRQQLVAYAVLTDLI